MPANNQVNGEVIVVYVPHAVWGHIWMQEVFMLTEEDHPKSLRHIDNYIACWEA